jgi:nucleoside-diphosphate-sugar epimerase
MNFILGSRGRIGKAIADSFPREKVVQLNRHVYANWWRDGAVDEISYFFSNFQKKFKLESSVKENVVYVAAGVLDANRSSEEHQTVNFLLAKQVIEGASRIGFRIVTFGTIMEEVIGFETANPYILSKVRLGEYVREFSLGSDLALHIRLHTIYGADLPNPFMFLGQLFDSIYNHLPFKMSSGQQLREYHHIDDLLIAISKLIALKEKGVINLNHGKPISLKELAYYVFEAFNCLELLNVGTLTAPLNENYNNQFDCTPFLDASLFRETLPSIVAYLRLCKIQRGELACLN